MSRHFIIHNQVIDSSSGGVGGQEFESPSAHHHHHYYVSGGRQSESGPSYNIKLDWQQFHQFLLQRMTAKTAEDRLRYAKRYASVLFSGISENLLQVSPNKRIHVMKALSSLARYTGQQDTWRQMRQQYGLQWSTGTEKIDAFTRFFDDTRDLDTMLQWLKEAIAMLPTDYANFFLFCTLTGMRASECVEAVRLINDSQTCLTYYNPQQQILQHYRFPDIFIRRTKAVYISVVNDQIVGIARRIGNTHHKRPKNAKKAYLFEHAAEIL